jgi:nucleoid-associated protein Lsr2
MATKTTILHEDDLEGGPAQETLRFSLGAAEYEIDLNTRNAAAFRQQLAPFTTRARKAGNGRAARPARTSPSRQRGGAIRAWAKEQGITVSDRGRIPASVTERYETATNTR